VLRCKLVVFAVKNTQRGEKVVQQLSRGARVAAQSCPAVLAQLGQGRPHRGQEACSKEALFLSHRQAKPQHEAARCWACHHQACCLVSDAVPAGIHQHTHLRILNTCTMLPHARRPVAHTPA
jgi:hypothetical protein